MKTYAGIGAVAPSLPREAKIQVILLGLYLAENGYCLHTGASEGVDEWFCTGAELKGGKISLHVPWKKYVQNKYPTGIPANSEVIELKTTKKSRDAAAFESVKQYHPSEELRWGAQCFHACNYRIVVPDEPVDFVVAYRSPWGGGTMQGIRVAESLGIPVVRLDQLRRRQVWEQLEKLVK